MRSKRFFGKIVVGGFLFVLLLMAIVSANLFVGKKIIPADAAIWDGSSDTSWYNESESEFTLTTGEQLKGLYTLSLTNKFLNKTIKLGNNIVLNDISNYSNWASYPPARGWIGIGYTTSGNYPFSGTFDGQGYSISGIYVSAGKQGGVGLFGHTDNATIKNLTIKNSLFLSSVSSVHAAAFSPKGSVSLYNCINEGNVRNNSNTSGFASAFADEIIDAENCINRGEIAAYNRAVGFANKITGSIKYCYNDGAVINAGDSYNYCDLAGIAFRLEKDAIMEYCYNNSDFEDAKMVAGLVLYNLGTIQYCRYNGAAYGYPNYAAGGIAAYNSGTIDSCFNNKIVMNYSTGTNLPGGIVGINGYLDEEGTVINCYDKRQGNAITYSNLGVVSNSYYLTFNPGDNLPKGTAKTATEMKSFEFAQSLGSAFATQTDANVNDGFPVLWGMPFADMGFGTKDIPFAINNAVSLSFYSYLTGASGYYSNKHFVVSSTFNMASIASLQPLFHNRTFTGTFDGKNKTVSNLTMQVGARGLFFQTSGATIQNLKITNGSSSINSSSDLVGTLVGKATNTVITNCSYVGTINNYATIGNAVGGLVGDANNCSISDCTVKININSQADTTGGIVGNAESGSITNCWLDTGSTIVSTKNNVGGIVGTAKNLIISQDNHNYGTITGVNKVGGIIGYSNNPSIFTEAKQDENHGTINGDNDVGGVYGYMGNIRIFGIKNYGTINISTSNGGGLIGKSTVTQFWDNDACIASGNVVGGEDSSYIGGAFGEIGTATANNAILSVKVSAASVSGGYYVGGIVGKLMRGTLSSSYSTSNVTAKEYAGGVVGHIVKPVSGSASVSTVYATGNITANEYAGGIAGLNEDSIISTYFSGQISVSSTKAIVGDGDGNVESSFYVSTNVPVSSNNVGTGKSSLSTGEVAYLLYQSSGYWGHTTIDGTQNPLLLAENPSAKKIVKITLDNNGTIVENYGMQSITTLTLNV